MYATITCGDTIGTGGDELVVEQCPTCAVIYAIPLVLKTKALERRGPQGKQIHCPNGHTWHYTGKTEAEKLREQLEEQQRRTMAARDLLEAEERSHAATRGHLTRTKKRVAAGVCPHPDCHRHFTNLERHVASKHPELLEQVRAGRDA